MNKIEEPQLSRIKDFLEERLGLHYTISREGEMSRKLMSAASWFNFDNLPRFVNWLLTSQISREDLKRLATHLTIGETYFLREMEAFNFLRYEYLKDYFEDKRNLNRELKIWSAGCATGEEVYSLAGLINEMIPAGEPWQISILGTDINPVALEKAEKGIYKDWSFRNTPSWFKNKYVTKIDTQHYQVAEKLKDMVKFSYHNLAVNLPVMTDVNIVFCRNVLIYFSQDLIRKVTARFYDNMADKGLMILSPVEVSPKVCERFIKCYYEGRTFYIKDVSSDLPYIHKGVSYQIEDIATVEEKHFPKEVKTAEESEIDHYNRIHFLFKEGLYLRVENLIRQISADIMQLSPSYQLLLAHTYANQGKLDQAEEILRKITSRRICKKEFCYLLATIYMEKGKLQDSAMMLQRTIASDPEFVMAYYYLGMIYKKQKNTAQSAANYQMAMEKLNKMHDHEAVTESDITRVIELKNLINSELKNLEKLNG